MTTIMSEFLTEQMEGLREDVKGMSCDIRELCTQIKSIDSVVAGRAGHSERIKAIEVNQDAADKYFNRTIWTVGLIVSAVSFFEHALVSHWK